jgi:MoaA/NifB/PqqE/SkfB family radical SAM enzyme
MIAYKDIKEVILEISSLCNASCPWCPRTFWGYPFNGGYPEVNLTLDNAKKIFNEKFLKQLTTITISGNYGDIVMNPDGPAIVEYFKKINPNLYIKISTNGSARPDEYWQRLACTGAEVQFCLDGLEDTHHLYRQNTSWATIIKNAKTFIAAGGTADWRFIQFDHNQHQIEDCRLLSKQLGFSNFTLINEGRNTAPVFNKDGELTHILGNYTGETKFAVLFHKKKTDKLQLQDITNNKTPANTIACKAQMQKFIYISATGDVSPCPWTGFYPKTYGAGQYHGPANAQLIPMINKNNALTYSLKECIEWFNQIKQSWTLPNFEQGRLVICDDVCGQN